MRKSILKIVFGNLLLGMAYAKLMVPHKIINGGVTSLALILSNFFALNVTNFANILTVCLLALGLVFLGKFFFFSSLLSSAAYLFWFNFFYATQFSIEINLVVDFILAVLFIAIGYYCCLSEDSSTAGLDVIAIILHKRYANLSVATFLRYLNIFVLIVGAVSYGVTSVIVGILFSLCFTKVLTWMTENQRVPQKKK
ncbi:hypothetical protein IGI37_002997 [Enterococcus sp. AZ194]|uniref:YitT family protein n=1 Tax=Enterococcus sp. AZ194 TaxID=2774629 RepID=UPI003F253605